jgi:DNA uptake protein ComE-like DNA-binding protein
MYIDTNFTPQKLLINQIGLETLAAHPYMSWQQARLIIAYRNQHGDFHAGKDLLKVYAIEEEDIDRIISYLDWAPSN